MTPIVFCASLVPCASEYAPAETNCARRDQRATGVGRELRKSPVARLISSHPRKTPRSGEMKMKATTLIHPDHTIAAKPAFAIAAPAKPPTIAWEEEEGML